MASASSNYDDTSNNITTAFREKVIFMKSWKPASPPANRDRLELYSLHKQAVSGDAPSTFSATANAADRAKYTAWRRKAGLSQLEAMRLYLSEADRQIRVYRNLASPSEDSHNGNGNSPSRPHPQTPQTTPNTDNAYRADTPRGLAAVPLLCAAAVESRKAYLRRLRQTSYDNAWWQRQEALCGTPGTITAVPEMIILQLARFIEHISLSSSSSSSSSSSPGGGGVSPVLQSFLWPLHNSLLALWILLILVLTLIETSWNILQIVVWGARRTGLSLSKVWEHDLGVWEQCQVCLCEPNIATTCRLVGLLLLPISFLLRNIKGWIGSPTLAASLFVICLSCAWWYFVFILPWVTFMILGTSCASGICFALIEAAGLDGSI